MSLEENRLDLSRIIFIGRTFEEYMAMFGLSEEELQGRTVLDCPGGACAFTARANALGVQVVSADIAYGYPIRALKEKGLEDIRHAMDQMEKARTGFNWEYFSSVEELREHRERALQECTADMARYPERYVPAVLPVLPFDDGRFDLTLSAHFLFMYGDRLDYDFHLKTLRELLRVTRKELRIYPLVGLSGERYAQMDDLLNHIREEGCTAEEVQVPYEFQKGTGRMLRILKG
ncbi:SAM-dependent methyltransferase [Paenibacillus rhizophilus]|uniref:SAM-dependent methyltransferase n=1 Tax=Paenibacillus rhizophilus TaxID=1850366 RepID=A0A3N9P9C8_9BACL|nr:SAM-dependent methyltransferase [Paenibacillus rhizophilus]RQW11927.1 SAM-dependent methyltransferase [Paenibacillus rhizophilus]